MDFDIQNSIFYFRYVSEIGFLDLDIIWNLGIEIWDFSTVSGKENRFFLNQLELTLTLLCSSNIVLLTHERREL